MIRTGMALRGKEAFPYVCAVVISCNGSRGETYRIDITGNPAVTEGRRTENLNKTGVRFWT
jgi:hypothetical protein